MKICLLSDIHGNASALKAVLSDIKNQNNVRHIYVVGDMIGIGPDTNEVLHLLSAREDVSMVTGNHDEAVLACCLQEPYPKSHQASKLHHEWIAEHIDPQYISLLKQLPRMISEEIMGHPFLFTHYHLRDSNAHISQDPFSSGYQT